jgi:Enoyl-(Acyl carrier protein) reductase
MDVTDSGRVTEVAGAVVSRHGRIDILVNSAGIACSETPAENVTDEHWLNVLDVNLNGTFWCCRAFGSHMLKDNPLSYVSENSVTSRRPAILNLFAGAIAAAVSGCAGPPVLERQVLGYDEVTKMLDEKLLLLNIARVSTEETIHFTSTSSIAATFNWATTLGVGGEVTESKGTNFLNLNIGGTASENPTFSISPISGKEFTERIATPFRDEIFEFLVFQGGGINQITRLMASGIEVQKPDGRFVRFIENDPRRPQEYEEFRRIAAHLQWLNDHRQLFVRPLVFEETLVADFKSIPRAEDINNGFNMGLRWRQKPNGNYELTRLKGGRVVVLNFDPMALTDQQRFALDEKIKKNPSGFVYLDIEPDGPGGNFPIQGAIKLRSMFQILNFIATGIRTAPEFDVSPDPWIRQMDIGPAATLKINITDTAPDQRLPTIHHEGYYYSVNDTVWDRTTFLILSVLFQTTIGKVENVGIPITISK